MTRARALVLTPLDVYSLQEACLTSRLLILQPGVSHLSTLARLGGSCSRGQVLPPAICNLVAEVSLRRVTRIHCPRCCWWYSMLSTGCFAAMYTARSTPGHQLLFRWPGELFQCTAPQSIACRGITVWLRPVLPIGDCGCMVCSPPSASNCFCRMDAVLARRRLAVEQSIRCHASRPVR
jgi:hypothetical protein